jgi:RNA polymerase sigma-70 factor (ECF subfamily)
MGSRRHDATGLESVSASSDPDVDLVRRSACGDRAAFEALLTRYYDLMHRIAWRFVGSRDDAEDIVQDVCCSLVEKVAAFRGEAKVSTWLISIVVNACRDHLRRASSLRRFKDRLTTAMGMASPPDGRDLYRASWLASSLGRLDPILRETVILVAGEELTHAEAAAVLGIAENTVSWRLHEARKRLKQQGVKEALHGL